MPPKKPKHPKKSAMTSRERLLAAIDHKPVDRVPTDIWAVEEVWTKLRAHFGETADLREALHIDAFAGEGPEYVGPPIPDLGPDERVDYWGIRSRRSEYAGGVYFEMYHNPLSSAQTLDDLEKYRWPQAEWFDPSKMAAPLREARATRAVKVGYMAPFFMHNKLRGLEQSLVDPLLDPEFTHHLMGRITDFIVAQHRRMFGACEGLIDVTEVTDDLGTQSGPMISIDTFREFYRPHIQRCIDLAKEFGIRVFHHDDGSCRTFVPDLIEMGIDILNPIQWRCTGMEIEGLKRDFGKDLCFHGAIDNQHTLPFGTEAEVRAEVRRTIDVLAADGTGYILAPCHNLQAITPVGNIIAMYDEAWKYGKRS